ncbi:uncharacterized protein LOC121833319 [Ixodes scapularis]|uniref:uncharacterized protein LOC121833319 n=1 Tax=Ixodes scapularis TaxID=6945 RepID=UPI001C38943B|nr:uncharacterized protein LOC121833319 [Ixodes scapularis]
MINRLEILQINLRRSRAATVNLDLIILNDQHSIPTFSTVNGESWIDLSIITPSLAHNVTHWENYL